MEKRRPMFRLLMLIGWFIAIWFATKTLVILLVSGYAGLELYSTDSLSVALRKAPMEGYRARVKFFRQYGDLVFLAQIVFTAILAWRGKLPYTQKYEEN